MYDPISLSEKTEQIVLKANKKKYYRFRPTKFYGGIATADTVGCNLRCKFCWSSNIVWNAKKAGVFYEPCEVSNKLVKIAELKGYSQLRVSGGEPTVGKKHLLELLETIPSNLLFILETNGLLLGHDVNYVKQLSCYPNLHVRVCLKGCDPEEFNLLTGAKPESYNLQIKSLHLLKKNNISFNIALASIKKNKQSFFKKLKDQGLGRIMLEEEKLKLYPPVKKRLKKEGILHYFEQ